MATLTPITARRLPWHMTSGFTAFDPDAGVTPTEAARITGLDTEVTMHPIFSHDGTVIERKAETWRDGHHLGIVGKDTYHPAPFMDAVLPYVTALTMETPLIVVGAGKFAGGAREAMVLAWPEALLVNGEAFNGFMYVQNSHDGSISLSLNQRKVRHSCTNQFPSIHRAAQIKLRHTKSWSTKVEQAQRAWALSLAEDARFEEQVRIEMGQAFIDRQFEQIVGKIAPLTDEHGVLKQGRSLTMAENAHDGLLASWKSDDLGNVRGTVFAAKQAVNAYYDWAYSSDKSRGLRAITASTDKAKAKAAALIDALV